MTRLPIDSRLAAWDSADRQGGLDGWRGADKHRVFTYNTCRSVPSTRVVFGGISKRTSEATSTFRPFSYKNLGR